MCSISLLLWLVAVVVVVVVLVLLSESCASDSLENIRWEYFDLLVKINIGRKHLSCSLPVLVVM